MLAYAANRPPVAERPSSPNALLLIIGAHVGLIALVMSMKMELPTRIFDPPIKLERFPPDRVPPEHPPEPTPVPRPSQGTVTRPDVIVPTTPSSVQVVVPNPTPPSSGELVGPPVVPPPVPLPDLPRVKPVKAGPSLLTPASELKPPYPQSKLLSEEQAVLSLRLAIDERGRVVAVDPVGRADPAFLTAARRHILAHWRYRPASEDGRPVATAITVTLHFRLDE